MRNKNKCPYSLLETAVKKDTKTVQSHVDMKDTGMLQNYQNIIRNFFSNFCKLCLTKNTLSLILLGENRLLNVTIRASSY